MKIGVRAHDFERDDPDILAEKIKCAGFETVQLALMKAIYGIDSFSDITGAKLEETREAFHKNAVEIHVLGCYIDPALQDKDSRLAQVELFKQGLANAKILGANLVGTETTVFPFGEEQGREQAYGRLIDSVFRMTEEAERLGVNIGIEPVAAHTLCSARLARRLLDEVGSNRLKIIFDPVNLLQPDTIGQQDEIIGEFLSLLGADIVAVHLKDTAIENGEMLWRNIGDGDVHHEPLFAWLRENSPDMRVLREEVYLRSCARDIMEMKRLIQG